MKMYTLPRGFNIMLAVKIISASLPLVIVEILRRRNHNDLIGLFQYKFSVLELLSAVLLLGLGQFIISKNFSRTDLRKVSINLILSTFIFVIIIADNFMVNLIIISIALLSRLLSSYFLSHKKFLRSAILNNSNILLLSIFILALVSPLKLFDYTEKIVDFKEVETRTVFAFIIFLIWNLNIIKKTWTFYIPRILGILQNHIDMLLLISVLSSPDYITYVILTRWTRLISFPLTVSINYYLPKYQGIKDEGNLVNEFTRHYLPLTLLFVLFAGSLISFYLFNYLSYKIEYVLVSVLISSVNLLSGPLGVPLIQGRDGDRKILAIFQLLEILTYTTIILNSNLGLLGVLAVGLLKMIFANLLKLIYIKNYVL